MAYPGVSIVVAAYKAQDCIGECLHSLLAQSMPPDEILVGVDGCQDTVQALSAMLLPATVRLYSFVENHGTYVVMNTLVGMSRQPYIIFFGADDVAYPWMVASVLAAAYDNPDGKVKDIVSLVSHDNLACRGAMGIVRESLNRLGGFEPWRCAADWELQARAARNGLSMRTSGRAVFRRYVGPSQLSAAPATGMQSDLRKEYHRLVASGTKFRVEPETAQCVPLTILPTATKWSPRPPTLGVSMIVRDEQDCLDKCLQSVAGVDELVVVDTGSKDGTPDIARKHNAKVSVGEYAWKDEYDDARNFAMARCTTDWILSIDADEELEPDGIARIRALISAARPDQLVFGLRMVAAQGKHEHHLARLWRNHCGVQFTYAGHEVLTRVADVDLGITIKYGYSPAHKGDPDRMLRILTKGLEKRPDCPRYLFYLAREHVYHNNPAKAIELYERYLKVGKFAQEMAEAHLQLARCYGKLNNWDGAKINALRAVLINADWAEALIYLGGLCGPKNRAKWTEYAKLARNQDVLFRRI